MGRPAPPIFFKPVDGGPVALEGYTDHPEVARHFREFLLGRRS